MNFPKGVADWHICQHKAQIKYQVNETLENARTDNVGIIYIRHGLLTSIGNSNNKSVEIA
jgi:hypothetical protein